MILFTAPEPVLDPATNSVGNSDSETLRLIQRLQRKITMPGNHQPPNPSDPLQKALRNHQDNVSKFNLTRKVQ